MATWPGLARWERTSSPHSSILLPDELAFIANNFIHLDHDQTWTGSAGIAYTLNMDSDHPTLFLGRCAVQSGLRAMRADVRTVALRPMVW